MWVHEVSNDGSGVLKVVQEVDLMMSIASEMTEAVTTLAANLLVIASTGTLGMIIKRADIRTRKNRGYSRTSVMLQLRITRPITHPRT